LSKEEIRQNDSQKNILEKIYNLILDLADEKNPELRKLMMFEITDYASRTIDNSI
jgi:hypothetical protein